MPKKHISLSESYLGLGAYVLEVLSKPMTVDECWNKVLKKYINKNKISKKHSFNSFILTLDFLFCINAIDLNQEGELYNVSKKNKCE